MERNPPAPVPSDLLPASYETSSNVTHRRAERQRTYVERPRHEARM